MPSGFVIPLRMVALDCSGLVTPQWRVAPAACFVSSFRAWAADLAPSWSLYFSKVVGEKLSSEQVPHPAVGRRSKCQLHLACGLLRSLPLPAPASKFVNQDALFGVGAEPCCVSPHCLRLVWSGCRRSLPLPAPVLYSLKQHFPLSF